VRGSKVLDFFVEDRAFPDFQAQLGNLSAERWLGERIVDVHDAAPGTWVESVAAAVRETSDVSCEDGESAWRQGATPKFEHELSARLSMRFELREARPERVDHVLRTLRWFTLAESLGGVESLVAHPASMTHASMTPEARRQAGITGGVIRLPIGIEDSADLIADLEQSLARLPA
jgi:hypothetical protein